ncbi:MAG: hypothetical protein HRT57_12495 [Crocinitomicaceae bacterium]|nr:hypothetical protein [Crocinitomicaceae bacterium]
MKIIYLFSLLLLFSCGDSHLKEEEDLDENKESTEKEILSPIKIEVYGQQFHWTAHYAGADNEFPKFDYKTIQPENDLGIITSRTIETSITRFLKLINRFDSTYHQTKILGGSEDDLERLIVKLSGHERLIGQLMRFKKDRDKAFDKFAWDDFLVKDTVYLLKGVEHELSVRAKDVIHSAYLPYFRAQINAIPGMSVRFKFTPDNDLRNA